MTLSFQLHRDVDVSGVSGTGIVADGVRFPDGSCALRWRTQTTSTAVYSSVDDVRVIHCHGAATRLVWQHEFGSALALRCPFVRGQMDCIQDYCENAPFGSVGGVGARQNMAAPHYIPEAERAEYLAGYRDMAWTQFGSDWRDCSFGWAPVLTISTHKGAT